MSRGGYRKPSTPAPVSGPGSLSRRTDGGPTQGAKYMSGGKYGEGKALMETQQAAPMAAAAQPTSRPAVMAGAGLPAITQLTAPTERPNEPITHGLPFGDGGGPEVLGRGSAQQSLSQLVGILVQHDPTGDVQDLYDYLVSRGM